MCKIGALLAILGLRKLDFPYRFLSIGYAHIRLPLELPILEIPHVNTQVIDHEWLIEFPTAHTHTHTQHFHANLAWDTHTHTQVTWSV